MKRSIKNYAIIIVLILNIFVLCIATYKSNEHNNEGIKSSIELLNTSDIKDMINNLEDYNEIPIEDMLKKFERIEQERKKNEGIFDKILQSNIIYIICALLVSFHLLFKWWDDFEYQAKRFQLYFLVYLKNLSLKFEPYIKSFIVITMLYLELDLIYDTIFYNNNISFVLRLMVVNELNDRFYYFASIILISLSIIGVIGMIKNKLYGVICNLILYGLIISFFCLEVYMYGFDLYNTVTISSILTLSLMTFMVLKYKSLNITNNKKVEDA